MSRRDTIIIAVLINAGLLVVLFSTALKSNHKEDQIASAPPAAPRIENITEVTLRKEPTLSQGDEVDQVLRQFSQSTVATTNNALSQPALASPVGEAEKKEEKRDFTQDLNAITFSQPQVQTPLLPVTGESNITEVIVKKGDVLEKIARTHHTSVDEIMRLNQLNSTRLKIGQVLKVSTQSAKKSEKVSESTAKYYTVKNGDNPWTIAVKNHMKVEELLKLNHLDQDKARHLKPGDQLRIR